MRKENRIKKIPRDCGGRLATSVENYRVGCFLGHGGRTLRGANAETEGRRKDCICGDFSLRLAEIKRK